MKQAASLMLSLLAGASCWGQEPQASVALEAPARVGMPVWLKISTSNELRYPFYTVPDWHECHDVEVRKDGKPLPRFAYPTDAIGKLVVFAGPACGTIYLPGNAAHPGSIPLHLMYRFLQPGIYEVRYVERAWTDAVTVLSPWTLIEIQAATPADRATWLADVSAHAPTDAMGLLSGYLPDILGVPDDGSLELLAPYLAHPDSMVRQYVSHAVSYWPGLQAARAILATLRTHGPNAESAQLLAVASKLLTADEKETAVETAFPYLKSDSPMALIDALEVMRTIALGEKSQVSGEWKQRVADAVVDAEAHVVALGNADIANAYVQALFAVKDARAPKILWSFVDRGIAQEQAIICLAWLHSPADLPKLAQRAMPHSAQLAEPGPGSLPYALRYSYGDAALPYIEEMLQRSPFVFVRTASAQELVNAGRPSGFAFIVDAMEQNRPYRAEMVQFLRDRFPELGSADDAAVLRLAQIKATAK